MTQTRPRSFTFAATVIAGLLFACSSNRPLRTVTPTATATATAPSSPTPSLLATPTGPIPTDEPGRCRYYTDLMGRQTGFSLQLSPSAPKSGEVLRVSGSGLPAGQYVLGIGVPQSGNVVLMPMVTVGTDGRLDGAFTVPARYSGICVIVFANPGTGVPYPVAQPFVP